MFRFLTLTVLSVMTSGCLIGVASVLPAGNPNQSPDRTGQQNPPATNPGSTTQPNTPSPPSGQTIVGRWTTTDEEGNTEIAVFRPDGSVTIQNSAAGGITLQGQYVMSGNSLTMTFPSLGTTSNTLTFSSSGQTVRVGDDEYRRS